MTMKVVHLVARLREGRFDLGEPEHAAWLWERVREAFSGHLLAELIMPNHPHVLALTPDPKGARRRLAWICGHLQRRVGVPRLFEPLPDPTLVDPSKVARVARYIELNANRAGLVAHPLEWRWTTLRDVVGATANPVVDAGLHAQWVRPDRRATARGWLQYVVTDDRVADRRELAPPAEGNRRWPSCGVDALLDAVTAALRCDRAALERRGPGRALLIACALDQGLTDLSLLAGLTGCTRRAVELARHRPADPRALAAVRQCLAEPRLRLAPTPPVSRSAKPVAAVRRPRVPGFAHREARGPW